MKNPKEQVRKIYDLEQRTLNFMFDIKQYVYKLPKDKVQEEFIKQLIRSAGSVGANYIEANEAMSKKDFLYRCKISKKEAKESRYWLYLTDPKENRTLEKEKLIKEATELMNIFGAIISKSKEKNWKSEI